MRPSEGGKIEGDVDVNDYFTLTGVISGSVRVEQRGAFRLIGVVAGDLVVEPGGETELFGVVAGDAINTGGSLTVVGVVVGRLRAQAGHTRLDEKATVVGGVQGSVERIRLAR